MKKSFPLQDPRHQEARVVEQIKSDIRKYLKRERRKSLPDGVDYWDFTCRSGKDSSTAQSVHVADLIAAVDTASKQDWPTIYIEILAKPGHRRTQKQPPPSPPESAR